MKVKTNNENLGRYLQAVHSIYYSSTRKMSKEDYERTNVEHKKDKKIAKILKAIDRFLWELSSL